MSRDLNTTEPGANGALPSESPPDAARKGWERASPWKAKPRRWRTIGIPVLVIALVVGAFWAAANVGAQQTKDPLARQTVELLTGAFHGDASALAKVLPTEASHALLTPGTATAMYGKDTTVLASSGDVALGDDEATVRATVKTKQGDIPVELSFQRRKDDPGGWSTPTMSMPTLDLVVPVKDMGTEQLALAVNGAPVHLDLGKQDGRTAFYLWPGRSEIALPQTQTFALEPASTELNLSTAAHNTVPEAQNAATISLKTTVSSAFSARAKIAVKTVLTSCTGRLEQLADSCPVWPPQPPRHGAQVRGYRLSLLTDPSGAHFAVGRRDGTWTYSANKAQMLGRGEWLDGDTWRAFEEVQTLKLTGTLTTTGDRLAYTQDPAWTLAAHR